MKESMPHHAENHGLAPGPGKASKLWTFILFLESEGGQGIPKELVKEMKDIPKGDTKRRELSCRASLDTLKAVEILPGPIQSQVITTIYNDQRNQIISPAVQQFLNRLLAHSSGSIREEEEPESEG
jgi:hypothetical protein